MIQTRKKFIFKTVSILLDDSRIDEFLKKGYANIRVTSYVPLHLPRFRTYKTSTGVIPIKGRTAEEILMSFSETRRKHVRRSYRRNMAFRRSGMTTQGWQLYCDFQKELKKIPAAREDFENVIEFGAYENAGQGRLLSALWVYPTFPNAYMAAVFSRRLSADNEEAKFIAQASSRLHFDVCMWCVASGRSGLDLAKLSSPTGFKATFNPEIIPLYFHSYSSRTYQIAEIVMSMWRFFQRTAMGYKKKEVADV